MCFSLSRRMVVSVTHAFYQGTICAPAFTRRSECCLASNPDQFLGGVALHLVALSRRDFAFLSRRQRIATPNVVKETALDQQIPAGLVSGKAPIDQSRPTKPQNLCNKHRNCINRNASCGSQI